MRKITSILMLLLFVFSSGVSAQGIKVSTDAEKHWYQIKNFRSGKYAAFGGETADNLKDICQKDFVDYEKAFYWYVVKDVEGYRIHNLATTKVVNGHGWSEAGCIMYIAASQFKSGYYTISSSTNQSDEKCWDGRRNGTDIGDWYHISTDNEGTSWEFVEATIEPTDLNLAKIKLQSFITNIESSNMVDDSKLGHFPNSAMNTAKNVLNNEGATAEQLTEALNTLKDARIMPNSGKYYVITSSYGGYEENQGVTKSIYATVSDLKWKTTDLTDKTMYWCVSKTADGNWTFQNYGNKKYIGASAGQGQVFKMADDPVAGSFVWYPNDCNIKIGDQCFHTGGHNNGTGVENSVISYSAGSGSGSAWTLREVEDPEAEIAKATAKADLQAAITKANILVGINPGQYPSTDAYFSALAAAQEMLNNATATKDDYDGKRTALETALEKAQIQTKNDLEVGCYYRIQNTAHKTYTGIEIANQSAGTSQMKNYTLNEDDPRQIWKLEQDGGKYYLVNVASGLYPQLVAQGAGNTTAVGAKDASKNFTWKINAEATSTSKAQYNIFVGTVTTWNTGTQNGQINVEANGNVNYWYGNNAHHYLWKVEKTDAEILTLVNNWAKSQNLTDNANATKLQVIDGVTQVISPNEFAEPSVVNAAIDAVKEYAGASAPTLEQAQALYNNYAIVNSYMNNVSENGGILNVEYDLKGQYGTIILPVNYKIPTGLKFYTCNGAENGVLTLEEASGAIKNTPYIVEYTGESGMPEVAAPNKYQIIGYQKGAATTNQTVGWLTGVLEENGCVPSGSYILSKYKGRFAFYQVDGDNVKMATKYRCYLTIPADQPTAVSAFYLNGEGETTGINALLNGNNGETEIYDLSGKRFNHLQKGINIVNGQKVLVK